MVLKIQNSVAALSVRIGRELPVFIRVTRGFVGLLVLFIVAINANGQCPSNISFTLQPNSQTVCSGGSVVFEANVTGTAGTVSFDWQRKRPSDPGFTSIGIPSATVLTINNTGSLADPDQTQYQVSLLIIVASMQLVQPLPRLLLIHLLL